MASVETYSLDQIHTFLTTERAALHGTSPVTYEQNQALAAAAQDVTAEIGLAGVQFLGSRAHGVSAPNSDLEYVVLYYNDVPRPRPGVYNLRRRFDAVLSGSGDVDGTEAVRHHRLGPQIILDEPELFIKRFEEYGNYFGGGVACLFEQGVCETPSLRLAGMALLQIIAAKPADGRQKYWQEVQATHAAAYLGDLERMRTKLQVRLPLGGIPRDQVLPIEIHEQRQKRFGLAGFDDTYSAYQTWLVNHQLTDADEVAYDLYKGVTRLVKP